MREEKAMEGAYKAKLESFGGSNDNKNVVNSPCPHCKKSNHMSNKCWWRPDIKCIKYVNMGHIERVCKEKQSEAAKVFIELQEEDQLFVATRFVTNNDSSSIDNWLIDSGYTNHMTNNLDLFTKIDKTLISKVKIGNGEFIFVKGKGTMAVESLISIKHITDGLYVPDIDQNFLSVRQLVEKVM